MPENLVIAAGSRKAKRKLDSRTAGPHHGRCRAAVRLPREKPMTTIAGWHADPYAEVVL
jgi:hypothetical protein